jgi:hypothetical protein
MLMYLKIIAHITKNTAISIVEAVLSIASGSFIVFKIELEAFKSRETGVVVLNKGILNIIDDVAFGKSFNAPVNGLIYIKLPPINLNIKKGNVLDELFTKCITL